MRSCVGLRFKAGDLALKIRGKDLIRLLSPKPSSCATKLIQGFGFRVWGSGYYCSSPRVKMQGFSRKG